MAQLLLYYTWPNDPVGITSFNIYINGHSTTESLRGGAGIGGAYDWGNMVLDPDASTPDIQRQAIGALTHDAGVAVHTNYAYSGSGAYSQRCSHRPEENLWIQ